MLTRHLILLPKRMNISHHIGGRWPISVNGQGKREILHHQQITRHGLKWLHRGIIICFKVASYNAALIIMLQYHLRTSQNMPRRNQRHAPHLNQKAHGTHGRY